MENFEAVGRYVTYKEKAKSHAIARNNALKDLAYITRVAVDGETSYMIAVDFDFARAHELLRKAADAHSGMAKAVAETNAAADACGQPRLMVGK